MPNYQNGKIYLLKSPNHDKVYVGSTTQTLKERLRGHIKQYNKFLQGDERVCSSYEILEKGDTTIELYLDYPCQTKQELLWKERDVYEIFVNECINKQRPIVNKEEKKKLHYQRERERFIKNPDVREKKRLCSANYYKANKDSEMCCIICRMKYKSKTTMDRHYRKKHHDVL